MMLGRCAPSQVRVKAPGIAKTAALPAKISAPATGAGAAPVNSRKLASGRAMPTVNPIARSLPLPFVRALI
ncbi:hypothetical protein BH23PSE1_BH23PSE1_09700 [soil metagenome]